MSRVSAEKVLAAAVEKSEELDVKVLSTFFHDILLLKRFTNEQTSQFIKCSPSCAQMNISVVDNGANLVGFLRMDGAWLGSVDIAMKKVRVNDL